VTEKPRHSTQSDTGLGHATGLAARILEFIASDDKRSRHFLQGVGVQLATLREAARSPMCVLSVLDAVARDEQILRALHEHERITPDMIELARARLEFQTNAAGSRRADAEDPQVVREKFFADLQAVLKQRWDQELGQNNS
jgi:hypothetical protein